MSNLTTPSTQRKVLFVRMDRIGDLVLTLPADEHPIFAQDQIHWFISSGLGFVARQAVPPRSYTEWNRNFSWSQFFKFIKEIRRFQPDVSISFHSPWWVTLALWWARVPTRIGVLSSWHSYLFLNKGLRQKRSRCEMHELDYNHQLIQKTMAPDKPPCTHSLRLSAPVKPLSLPESYVVVHPGMAGSALNWPLEHYQNLILSLSRRTPVIITGTAIDRSVLNPLRENLSHIKNILWKNESLSSDELLITLKKAEAVFAPSTGVIHLAASLGTPTYGIYSPVVVQRVERWGPRGPKTKTWTPQVPCPSHFRCQGSSCSFYNCMALVSPQEIAHNIETKTSEFLH